MSFDKHYANRKDKRKQYFDSRKFDRTCRSRGSCVYCQMGRSHKNEKRKLKGEIYDAEVEI